MKKTAFRNLVVPFFILIFLSHSYAQRWVPEDDYKHIKTFNNVLEKTIKEISLIKPQDKNGKKYFSNKQYDQIERLYFRYTLCTRSLLDIVNAYKDIANKSRFKKNNAQAFILGYCASLSLYKHSAELIIQTAGNQLLIDKLNEEYPRTEIKGNGLNYICLLYTSPSPRDED